MTIFIIPFAGGSSYSFQKWEKTISTLKIIVIDLPGKGRRYKERFLNSISEVVDDVIETIYNYLNNNPKEKYAIWGHSMGGIIAYEVVNKIESTFGPEPSLLMLSATPPPNYDNSIQIREYLKDEDLFFKYLSSFGLFEVDKLNNQVFKKLFLPGLINDFKLLSTYKSSKEVINNTRGVIITGCDDISYDVSALNWRKYFKKDVLFWQYNGGHFFIFNHFDDIIYRIKNLY